MPSDHAAGTIPLDDMRTISPCPTLIARENRAPGPTTDMNRIPDRELGRDRSSDKSKQKVERQESHHDSMMPANGTDLNPLESLGYPPVKLPGALTPSSSGQGRAHDVAIPAPSAPFPDAFSPDHNFETALMSESIHAPDESFSRSERETFAPHRQRAPSEGPEPGQSMAARKQLHELQAEIQMLKAERDAAKSEAGEAMNQMESLKTLLKSDMQEVASDAESLGREMRRLRDENKLLREGLDDAQSHIFSLQPYSKELTSEEVSRQYYDLVEHVQDWVQKLMDPWLDDCEASATTLLARAHKQSNEASRFRKTLQRYPDLVHGAMFPETDEDIIVAIIMRFLNDCIFQKILYGSIQTCTNVISFIETMMQASVEPKRDLFAVRTWVGESYNALLSAPEFKGVRARRSKELTMELASVLQILSRNDDFSRFCQSLEAHCIAPAMELYEKLRVSTHHFYLDINPYITWGPGDKMVASSEFIANMANLDCHNVLQNRKAFHLGKLDPQPSKEQLHDELVNVCTVVPALYVRRIGQRDNIKPPTIVCKQRMLVAWGSEEKREKFANDNDPTLVARLFFPKARKRGAWYW